MCGAYVRLRLWLRRFDCRSYGILKISARVLWHLKKKRKMQFRRFRKLSLSVQSAYLWTDGELICSNITENSILTLYALYGTLIEVKLQRPSQQVEAIRILDSRANVDRYLDQIMLPKEIMPNWNHETSPDRLRLIFTCTETLACKKSLEKVYQFIDDRWTKTAYLERIS